MLLDKAKANLAVQEAKYAAYCSDPEQPITKCLINAGEAIPGTPQQLNQAGDIASDVASVAQGGIAIIEGVGAGSGTSVNPGVEPVPVRNPNPVRTPLPVPQPAFP
jgi:hypothetical protein